MKSLFTSLKTVGWFYLTILGLSIPVNAFKYVSEGMPAPEIEGVDMRTGDRVSSSALYQDNLVIVCFWAAWSARSMQELDDLKVMAGEYADQPIRFIAVNVNSQTITPQQNDSIETVVSRLELPFPVIIDDGLRTFYEYGVIAVPSTAVIDTSGNLRYGPPGYSLTTRDRLVDSIRSFLGMATISTATLERKGYQPTDKASRFYNLAVNLVRTGKLDRALSGLQQALAADPDFPAPHRLCGEVFLQQSKFQDALDKFETALSLDSTSAAAWAGRGQALYFLKQLDSAEASLSTAIRMDSTFVPALLFLSRCQLDQGRPTEALSILELARAFNANDPAIFYGLGKVHEKTGNVEKAVESFITALDIVYPAPRGKIREVP